jgi:predicted peptidase
MQSITRRDAVRWLVAGSAAALIASHTAGACRLIAEARNTPGDDASPALAPGTPTSAERLALIEAFNKESEGLGGQYEARTYKGDWEMPYRLFRPAGITTKRLPLIMYLHGSGGLGTDNVKQLGLGNVFGTRVWLLPQNQANFPCYAVAPQTDRGWSRYDFSGERAKPIPGFGDGARLAAEVVDSLVRELPIDRQRIYVAGQSMGGAGVWNVIANRPELFAAAIVCCGSLSAETGAEAIKTPMWCFHGDADATVSVAETRDRVAARRKAGGKPLYTEYAGVNHNCWEWAFTEPALVKWTFAQRRA